MTTATILIVGAVLLGSIAHGLKCSEQETGTRHVLCYYEGRTSLENINFCNCTHIILTNAVRVGNNYTIDLAEDAKRDLEIIKERKHSLTKLFTFAASESNFLESESKSLQIINEISNILNNFDLNGVEINFPLTTKETASKDSVTSFVKALKKKIENSSRVRVKRAGYHVSENLQDDITTAPYRTETTKTSRGSEKYQTTKKSPGKRRKNHRSRYGRREQEEEEVGKEEKTETRLRRTRKELRRNHIYEAPTSLVTVRLPIQPEIIAKKFDLKALSRYADLMVVSTYNITDESEGALTYHPSRLMGLSDMLNADSILDFLTGLGAEKSKIVLTLPATILKFQLEDDKKTTPRSSRVGQPEIIDQSQLCPLFSNGNWTVERDDDLTAPYAFQEKTWLAYEDKISVNIKAKYILLRELAGGGVYPIDADTGRDPCNDTISDLGYLVNTLYGNFMKLDRKPRGLVLESLQQDIHDTAYSSIDAAVHQSEYRIVRVVDHSGAVHVIRKNTKTQFECSRQGYFSHPLGCNKFYRCVKFNQYTDDFTVFEYDCPAGLAFDERWEVCVWPGSLPHGAPCTGSSEIAPVPRSHYQCPNHEGYYADPENCRWFFACLDHARDGVTPLTAYEFRCPFGLVFNEQNLACDWPWNVGACGNRGFSGVIVEHHGGSSSSLHSANYANTGGFGSGFSASSGHQQGASAQSGFFEASVAGDHSGSGYIAGHFDDNHNRASFATIPDFEVSGGRILNHGGLVLNQNINIHGASGDTTGLNKQSSGFLSQNANFHGASVVVSGLNKQSSGFLSQNANFHGASVDVSGLNKQSGGFLSQSGNFHGASVDINALNKQSSGFLSQNANFHGATVDVNGLNKQSSGFLSQSGNFHGASGDINTLNKQSNSFSHSQKIAYDSAYNNEATIASIVQTPTPVPAITKLNQFVYEPPLSSPRPFSVSVPEVQINQEEHSAGISLTHGFTTPRVETLAFLSGAKSGSINSFSVSSESAENNAYVHESTGFGQKINGAFAAGNAQKQFEIHGSTAAPAYNSHAIHSGFEKISQVSTNAVNHGSNGGSVAIDTSKFTVTPKTFQQSNVQFASADIGTNYRVSSTTPAPSVVVHENVGVSGASILVTPQPEVNLYHVGGINYQSGIYKASNGSEAFIHRPLIEVSTAVPLKSQGFVVSDKSATSSFSGNAAGSFHESRIGSHSAGNAILLEEKVERVVIPKIYPTPAPGVTYSQPSVSVKPDSFSSLVKTSATPGTTIVTVEPQNFIGPIEIKSPAPQPPKKTTIQHNIVSTPAPNVVNAADHLVPVQQNFNQYQASVQSKFVQPIVSTSAPIEGFRKSEFAGGGFLGRTNNQITVLKEASRLPQTPALQFPQFVLSTPTTSIYKGPEYLPPAQSKITVQQNAHHFIQPVAQTKVISPVASSPAPTVYTRQEYASNGVAFNRGVVNDVTVLKPVAHIQRVSTPAPTIFSRPQYVASEQGYDNLNVLKPAIQQVHQPLPSPKIYKAPEYLPPVQTISTARENVHKIVQTPIVETKFVQSSVSTPAPAVSVKPQLVANGVAIGQGNVQFKSSIQNVQTYTQTPAVKEVKFVQPVSTPAPSVYRAPEYLPPLQINQQSHFVSDAAVEHERTQLKQLQQNIQTYSQIPIVQQVKLVQPAISTAAPAVFKRPEYTAKSVTLGQGNVQLKSSIQENIQTYSQVPHAPVVQEINFVKSTVSTSAPPVYKAPEYLPPVKVNEYRPIAQTKFVQPVVATPVPAVFRKPEFVESGYTSSQGNVQVKSSIQQNIQTYSQYPAAHEVKIAQPAISTPAPNVYKAPEYLPPVQVNEFRPIVTSTPATVYRRPESVTSSVNLEKGRFDGGVTVLKPVVQQAHQVSPALNVYKAPEYLPPVVGQRSELKSSAQDNEQLHLQTPNIQLVKPAVSTPTPTIVSIQQNQGTRFRQQPVSPQSYNFVPSTTTGPINYEQKEIFETVSFPPPGYQQDILRTRAKAKQLFHTVQQPEISVHYQQPVSKVINHATYELKSSSPSPAQVFSYQSSAIPLFKVSTPKSEILETPITPKPALIAQPIRDEKLSLPISVTQNTIEVERSTSKPYVYEEYISISSPKPEVESPVRLQQPIVVTESPKQNILQQVLLQPQTLQKTEQGKTVYYENFEKTNPVVTVLEKEVVQPVVQQETLHVSSEPSVIINEGETVDYFPPTGQEIENYSNFEFQKIDKANTGFNVERTRINNVGTQNYESGRGNRVIYKVNSNIEIAPPPEEYLLEVTPKLVTTTAAPIQTTTAYRARARPTTSTVQYTFDEDYGTNSQRNKATVISVGQVDDAELEDGNVESLLEKYSGNFGSVLGREKFVTKVVDGEEAGKIVIGSEGDASTIGYDVSTSRSGARSRYKSTHKAEHVEEEDGKSDDTTVASLDLKNLKLKKNKKTVIIVSQVSDANPLLIGKLAGQCSCQSNKLQFRKKVARLRGRTTTTTTTYAPPYNGDEVSTENVLDSLAIEASTPKTSSENVIFIDGSRSADKSRDYVKERALFTPEEPRRRIPSRKGKIAEITGNEVGQALFTPVSAAEIARTEDYAGTRSKVASGPSFDRYGPGGLRGFDETLQGSVDCERPGLFRHPKYCNKFYACNYDPWKKRYTLHVFNCPIHLSYDTSISACNWPSKGPACSDDHLLI